MDSGCLVPLPVARMWHELPAPLFGLAIRFLRTVCGTIVEPYWRRPGRARSLPGRLPNRDRDALASRLLASAYQALVQDLPASMLFQISAISPLRTPA